MAKVKGLYFDSVFKEFADYDKGIKKNVENTLDMIEASKQLIAISSNLAASQKTIAEKRKALTDAEKEAAKITKQLNDLDDEVVKGKLRFSKATAEQRNELKQLIILEDKQSGTLEKVAAKTALLRMEKKKLDLETQEGKDRLVEINAELDKNTAKNLESADGYLKQKMQIGGYKDQILEAADALGFQNTRLGGMVQGLKSATAGAKAFIATPLGIVVLAIAAAFVYFNKLLSMNRKIADRLAKLWGGLKSVLGGLEGLLFGYSTNLKEAWQQGQKLVEIQIKLKRTANDLGLVIANMRGEYEKFNIIADDTTRSFREREFAQRKAAELSEEMAKATRDRASAELEEATLSLSLTKAGSSAFEEQLLIYKEAKTKQIEAEAELTRVIQEEQKRRGELVQDRVELELDYTRDAFDNQKTINEQIISDETVAFDKRVEVLAETRRLQKDSYNEQIALIQQFSSEQIDSTKLLQLNNKELVNYANSLGLSEAISKQLLDTIRDQRSATQDLTLAQKDLNKEQIEMRMELSESILESEQELMDQMEELADEEMDAWIENEERKREEAEKTAAIEIEMREKVRDATEELFISGAMAIFDFGRISRDKELADLEKQLDNKTISQEQYEEKVADIKRKQDRSNRTRALFNVAIESAQNIVEAFPNPILIGAAVALGAIQAGLIASEPLPEYWTGTKSSKEGMAWVGERGYELGRDKNGNVFMTPNSATKMYLEAGTEIIPHEESKRIVQASERFKGADPKLLKTLNDNTDRTIREMRNQNKTEHARRISERKGYSSYMKKIV